MPKGRRSGNMHADGPGGIAGGIDLGGAGMGGYAPGGSGVEPQAMPIESPPVVVEQYSRTRHETEPLIIQFTGVAGGSGGGRVRSASGHEYETTPESCTCPDFRVRQHECRHIRALRQAMGLPPLQPGWRPGDNTVPQEVVPPEVIQTQHTQDEDMRDRLARFAELDNNHVFLSDDETAFNELVDLARTPAAYETENVLDGPDGNTFGIEIEYVGGDRSAIARELYQLGLARDSNSDSWHRAARSGYTSWSVETDGTVDGEVVSPILRDTPETWEQIRQVCEVIKRHGGRINQQCGGHVHIGKEPLDANVNRKNRLSRLIGGNEDVMYRVAAAGELNGRFRGYHYAAPIGSRVSDSRPRTDDAAEQRVGRRGGGYPGVAMRDNTVEFRYFNGSLTPEQIQANIKLAYHAVAAAATTNRRTRRGQFIPEQANAEFLGNHLRSGSNDLTSVKRMADAIFTKTKDKVSFLRSFLNSQWQSQS